MINKRDYIEENKSKINQTLNNNEIHKYINNVFEIGVEKYKEKKNLNGGYDIESYIASKGFSRVAEIGNTFCNSRKYWPEGVSADVILGQKIPVIRIENILLTLKSTKNTDLLSKKISKYMKNCSRLNSDLNPQLSIKEEILDNNSNDIHEFQVDLGADYYGILTYKLADDDKLVEMKVVFLDENAKSIVHDFDIPIILSESKIITEDKSLKSNLEINKGNSLRKIIELK